MILNKVILNLSYETFVITLNLVSFNLKTLSCLENWLKLSVHLHVYILSMYTTNVTFGGVYKWVYLWIRGRGWEEGREKIRGKITYQSCLLSFSRIFSCCVSDQMIATFNQISKSSIPSYQHSGWINHCLCVVKERREIVISF